jgi:hypothetical protein
MSCSPELQAFISCSSLACLAGLLLFTEIIHAHGHSCAACVAACHVL